jgi:hypothetical protein
LALAAGGPALAEEAELIKTFKDWAAYKHEAGGTKVCFAASQPKDSAPKTREDVYLYLSFFPGDNVKNEVSIRIGYALKPGSDVTVLIDGAKFALFSKGDKAFVADGETEQKFVEAMKRGNKLTVTATPAEGKETTDVYSLFGVTDAAKAAEAACS